MTHETLFGPPPGGAVFSADRHYRYLLSRSWSSGKGKACVFVMLNPSTADEAEDDRTIRRCIGFAKRWGYERLEVVNLFAWCATNPDDLYFVTDATNRGLAITGPVGPDNDQWIRETCRQAGVVIAAWGAHSKAIARSKAVAALLPPETMCLQHTKSGFPQHPLYIRGDVTPVPWLRPKGC